MVMITEGVASAGASASTNGSATGGTQRAGRARRMSVLRRDRQQGRLADQGAVHRSERPADRDAGAWRYEEGGTNNFIHRLPGRLKVGNVTLKRGLTKSNEFLKWCMGVRVQNVERRNVTVVMYDAAGKPVVRWNFAGAYPVKWIGPQFTADSSGMAIESVELAHKGVSVDPA